MSLSVIVLAKIQMLDEKSSKKNNSKISGKKQRKINNIMLFSMCREGEPCFTEIANYDLEFKASGLHFLLFRKKCLCHES
jgi:hypothetical protein